MEIGGAAPSRASGSLRDEIDALGPWFHNMELDGEWTAPDHFLGNYPQFKFDGFADALPDVTGKSVLDIGCNAGFYALEMKKRGAARVLGIDETRARSVRWVLADAGWRLPTAIASTSEAPRSARGRCWASSPAMAGRLANILSKMR